MEDTQQYLLDSGWLVHGKRNACGLYWTATVGDTMFHMLETDAAAIQQLIDAGRILPLDERKLDSGIDR